MGIVRREERGGQVDEGVTVRVGGGREMCTSTMEERKEGVK